MSSIIRVLLVVIVIYFVLLFPGVYGKDLQESIMITEDEDFIKLGFPGTGTRDNPYRIETVRINEKSNQGSCIVVANTTSYFVIRLCELTSSYRGISLVNVAPHTATLERNVILGKGKGSGVFLGSNGVVVLNNTCTNYLEGIQADYADDCIIVYNNVSHNGYHGISLKFSTGNLIAHNRIMGNGAYGVVVIRSSYNNRIYNNTFIDNSLLDSYEWDGIYSFNVTSQGRDERHSNMWYDEALTMGNFWSDFIGESVYRIDGAGEAVDAFPSIVKESISYVDEPTSGIPGYGPIFIVLGLIGFSVIHKLRIKTA